MRNHKSQTRANRLAHYNGLETRMRSIERRLSYVFDPDMGELDRLEREQTLHVCRSMRRATKRRYQ